MKLLAILTWTLFRLSFLCVGGGLSAIPEMQRQVVSTYGWLTPREFVDGYALSQVTPGPAMLVVTFIGYRVSGILGAFLATAAMFLPNLCLDLALRSSLGPPARPTVGHGRRACLASGGYRAHGCRRIHHRPVGGD